MGIDRPFKLINTQVLFSILVTSIALTSVKPKRCMDIDVIKASSGLSFILRPRTLKGTGLLHVRMAGLGNLASISILGAVFDSGTFFFLNIEDFFEYPGIPAWKVCGLLAYTSLVVGGGLGGSTGRNLKPIADLLFSLNMDGRCTVTLT